MSSSLRHAGLFLGLALAGLSTGRADEEEPSSLEMHRRSTGEPERSVPLHELLARALDAAREGDLPALDKVEKTLAPMNETIFRVFGLDVATSIRRAAAQPKKELLVRAVTGQVLLSIHLLLQECRNLTDERAVRVRLNQAILNYRVIESSLNDFAPAWAPKFNAAFKKLDDALTVDVKSALPAIKEIETLLLSNASPPKRGGASSSP